MSKKIRHLFRELFPGRSPGYGAATSAEKVEFLLVFHDSQYGPAKREHGKESKEQA